jgi:16S rRNA G527 N7-methylase RsmG
MQKAGATLNNEQKMVLGQFTQVVEKLNEAQNLLDNNKANEAISSNATALALVAIGKLMLISEAEEWGLLGRLPTFK